MTYNFPAANAAYRRLKAETERHRRMVQRHGYGYHQTLPEPNCETCRITAHEVCYELSRRWFPETGIPKGFLRG